MLSLKIGYFLIIERFGVLHFENAKPHIKQKKPTYKGELVKYKQIKKPKEFKKELPCNAIILYSILFCKLTPVIQTCSISVFACR